MIDASVIAGVVGAGTMGRGIAQLFAGAGISVRVLDADPGAARGAIQSIREVLDRAVSKGRLTAQDAAATIGRLSAIGTLDELSGCGVVVESIVEDLPAKQALMARLETVVADTCVLATNTSSISVTAIAAACRAPQRVAGLHFFNPAPMMKVVEVIAAARTAPAVVDALVDLVGRLGHRAVRAQDTPGFLVNHAGRGYGTEALRILSEGVASVHDIDRVMRDAGGFRMGPFELLDLTGLDVSHPVMESIYHQFYEEPRFRPSPETARRLAAGLLGRKTGEGFYTYVNGRRQEPVEAPPPDDRPESIWISGANEAARRALFACLRELPIPPAIDTGVQPAPNSLCVVTPIGVDATTAALAEDLDPSRVVGIDCLMNWSSRFTVMLTPATRAETARAAHGLLASGGTPVTVIQDSPGFILQRILAMVINVSCDIAQQRIASPEDIDDAVTLGLGYPYGPLTWGDRVGPGVVLAILEGIQRATADPRYRPSLWLRRRAQLGLSLRSSP